MTPLKALFVILVFVVAYNVPRLNQARMMASAPATEMTPLSTRPSTPFVAVPTVMGQSPSDVLIFAAKNCPHEDAQRADRLAADLSRSGLRVVRIDSINFALQKADQAEVDQLNALHDEELPIVFLHGRAKANPTIQEVLAEYNGTSRHL